MDSAYVLDSYAVLAHLENEEGAARVKKLLVAAREKRTKVYLSVVNFGEIYYITMRERSQDQAEDVRLLIEQLPIDIAPADKAASIEAAKLKATHPVAYADCFAAALGMLKKATVVTGDPEFKKFPDKIKIDWI